MIGLAVNTSIVTGTPIGIAGREVGATSQKGGSRSNQPERTMCLELELWYPVLRLREEGAEVVVVGPEKGRTFTSKHGYPATADQAADEVEVTALDAVIVPGGYAPDLMRRHPSMVRLVRDAHDRGALVAAICHAGWMLVSADVLRGRKATCVANIKDDVVNAGAEYVDTEAVRDGNLVTSRMPNDLPAFCRTIIAALVEARTGEAREAQTVTV
jgi:protease I